MILNLLIPQIKLFLQKDINFEIISFWVKRIDYEVLILKSFIWMIGRGGKVNVMVIISGEDFIK